MAYWNYFKIGIFNHLFPDYEKTYQPSYTKWYTLVHTREISIFTIAFTSIK